MKGVIAQCLAELVKEKFGESNWEDALEKSGLDRKTSFLATQDINDGDVLKVIDSTCKVLNISLTQAAEAFGDYWVNKFAPRIYSAYYSNASSSKEFLLKMDSVHSMATRTIPNAHPPRFEYIEQDDGSLIMVYKSQRGLIDFFIGLLKGVGKYFNENLEITKLDNERVKITFPNK